MGNIVTSPPCEHHTRNESAAHLGRLMQHKQPVVGLPPPPTTRSSERRPSRHGGLVLTRGIAMVGFMLAKTQLPEECTKREVYSSEEQTPRRLAQYFVALCHSAATTCVGAYSGWRLLQEEGSLCRSDEPWRNICLCVSAGYFIMDLALEVISSKRSSSMCFHHGFVGSFLFVAVQAQEMTVVLSLLFLNEASSLFLTTRWFISRIKEQRNGGGPMLQRWELANSACFAISFFVFRVALIPFVWFKTWQSGCLHFDSALGYAANINFPVLWGLNLFWFALVVKGVMRTLGAGKKVANESKLAPTSSKAEGAAVGTALRCSAG